MMATRWGEEGYQNRTEYVFACLNCGHVHRTMEHRGTIYVPKECTTCFASPGWASLNEPTPTLPVTIPPTA